jgi:small neutral amino acid transporter SnatA (MarC family)
MTDQYSYNVVNSFLVYCLLTYMFCFATFHLFRSIHQIVGDDGMTVIISVLAAHIVLQLWM